MEDHLERYFVEIFHENKAGLIYFARKQWLIQ